MTDCHDSLGHEGGLRKSKNDKCNKYDQHKLKKNYFQYIPPQFAFNE